MLRAFMIVALETVPDRTWYFSFYNATKTRRIYWHKRDGWSSDRLSASYFNEDEIERYTREADAQLPTTAYFLRALSTNPLISKPIYGTMRLEQESTS